MERLRGLRFWFLTAFLVHLLPGGGPAAETCPVDDDEYAVYRAVLFPVSTSLPKGSRPPLPGIEPGPGTLVCDTAPTSIQASKPLDSSLVDDFNRKNRSSCRMDCARFASILPEADAGRLRMVSLAEWQESRGRPAPAGETLFAPGVIRLSRVGFNQGKTAAAVEIHAIYDREAGVGYRVLLIRGDSGSPWVIHEAERTRIF